MTIRMKALMLAAALLASLACETQAAPTVVRTGDDGGSTAADMAQALLGGTGMTLVAGSASYTGYAGAAGTFSGGGTDAATTLGMDTGVVLSTGDAANLATANLNSLCCTDGNTAAGSALLDPLTHGEGSHNAAVLSFSVIPNASSISLKLVFGSEEYNDFVGPYFNGDVLGVFVNGVNYALVPGGNLPIGINSINCVTPSRCDLYRDNPPFAGGIAIQLDGLTTILTLTAPVLAGQQNLIQLGIADSFDNAYDSAVFFQAGSLMAAVPEPAAAWLLVAGLGVIVLMRRCLPTPPRLA